MKRFARSPVRAPLFGPLCLVLLVPALGWACIWDSDTLQDELQGRSSAYHVITGQVPQHGRAYYEKRLTRSLALLERASQSLEVLYDVAGAYMRLGEQDKAIEVLERADAIAPDRYKTHSNLGVAYFLKAEATKEKGDYESADAHTKRALSKRRDAHFGSGWLFQKVIEYKLAGSPEKQSFLGTDYTQWKASLYRLASERAKQDGVELEKDVDHVKPLLTLLRAHPDFADGYLVLALNFHNEWNLNLALWSYVRALELGHPRKDVIHEHIDEIFDHWKEVFKLRQQKQGQRLMPKDESLSVIRSELKLAALWLARFQEMEAVLVQTSPDLPDFDTVSKALAESGVLRRDPAAAGLVGGAAEPAAGSPTRSAHDEQQQARPGVNGPANAPREARSKQARRPGLDGEPPVGGPATDAHGPAQGSPAPRTRSSPPVMASREAPAHVSHIEADEYEVDGRGAADTPVPGGDAQPDSTRRQPTSSLRWFVIFGFAALAAALVAVALGRGRRA